MASTRNLNTPGDYKKQRSEHANFLLYNSLNAYGDPKHVYMPGNGLMPAKTCRDKLASNACDIESDLFGIGSTNLVTPKAPLKPRLNNLKSLDVFDKPTYFVVNPRPVNSNQRPMYMY